MPFVWVAMAACLFVVGAISPWESFEHLGGIIDRLEQLQASEAREAGTGPPPVVAETPARAEEPVSAATIAAAVSTGVAPRYEPAGEASHYVLFPKGLHWDWHEACRFYFERFEPTRGENVRDAARADVVTCINPDQETLDTLRRLNPAARLDVIRAATPGELSALVGQRILSGAAYGE